MRSLFLLATFTLAACGSAPSGPSGADLDAAKQQVHAFAPWDEAFGKVSAALGEPASVEGDTFEWRSAVADGACQKLVIQRMGDAVGTVNLTSGKCE